ncbi:MAG: hypothetical protein AB7O68_14620 [Pirellulales bacterium]
MPTKASTPLAHQVYKIIYSICDGEHEYDAFITTRFDHRPTTLECAIAVINEFVLDEHNRNDALRDYAEKGCFTLPGDCRSVSDFGAAPYVNLTAAIELLEAAKEALMILSEIQCDLEDDKGEAHCIDLLEKAIEHAEGR